MKWLLNIIFVITALSGAFMADFLFEGMPVVPRAHKQVKTPDKEKIVRFSKNYACQKTDQACIEHGMKTFSGLSSGLMN